MASATLSRWTRRFLVVGLVFLFLAGAAVLVDAPRRTEVVLGLYGFVLTTVFGKAYTLVPSYFDRTFVVPQVPAVHLPLQVVAVGCLAGAPLVEFEALALVGAIAWAAGVALFVGAIGATVATNPLGFETGTSDASADRAGLDRLANPFMPLAVGYLVVGSYELLAAASGLPVLLDGVAVRTTHLLAVGFALLLFLSVGYRLLPRFLVGSVPTAVAAPVLVAGAVGPALLAVGYPSGASFQLGAALVAVAVIGFAASYLWLFASSDRGRVGFYGPLVGVLLGVAGVGLGTSFAFVGIDPALAVAHRRLNVLGLLGVSILGVIFQFYPPAVSQWPGDGDRLALASIALVGTGVVAAAIGPLTAAALERAGGGLIALGGAGGLYLVVGAIWTQYY